MPDQRPPGIGHNRPPDPVYEMRRNWVSCDWKYPANGSGYPQRFVSYWRIYRDGVLIDSFLTKAAATAKLRQLQSEAQDA